MKLAITIFVALLLTGCNFGRGFQPPPYEYETYYKYKINDTSEDLIKLHMEECGFTSIYDNSEMLIHNKNSLVQAELCMEEKGYKGPSGRGGICSIEIYKNTEACQKHLRNGSKQ